VNCIHCTIMGQHMVRLDVLNRQVCVVCCTKQAYTNKQINEDHSLNALRNEARQVHGIGKEVKVFTK